MASSIINAPVVNAIGKGQTFVFNAIVSGYVSGSGNYVSFDLPCRIASNVTTATMSILHSIRIWVGNGVIKSLEDIDASYSDLVIQPNKNSIRVELKFASTQPINIPCTVNVQMSVAFS